MNILKGAIPELGRLTDALEAIALGQLAEYFTLHIM